jgi:hypothetical protein
MKRRREESIRRSCLFRGSWELMISSTFLLGGGELGNGDQLCLTAERAELQKNSFFFQVL